MMEKQCEVASIIPQFLAPPETALQSLRELLGAYETALHAGANFAQIFGLPLDSEKKAAGVGCLFSSPRPLVLQTEEPSTSYATWVDVIQSAIYDAELQDDGEFQARIEKGHALISLSKADYDFISTGIPQKLVNPHSYSTDLSLEIDAIELTIEHITHWEDTIRQCSSNLFRILHWNH